MVLVVKNMPPNTGRCKRHRFDPWVGKDSLEEGMATIPVFFFLLPNICMVCFFSFLKFYSFILIGG